MKARHKTLELQTVFCAERGNSVMLNIDLRSKLLFSPC